MGRKTGRMTRDTRAQILQAAATQIRTRGLSATLDEIAAEAGVSKGGLIYHYGTKESLIAQLAQTLIDQFQSSIEEQLEPDDSAPGSFARAYKRAVLNPGQDGAAAKEGVILLAQLMVDSTVAEIVREANEQLTERLRTDGLPDELTDVVTAAANGAVSQAMWGAEIDLTRNRQIEMQLLTLTRHPEWWTNLPWGGSDV